MEANIKVKAEATALKDTSQTHGGFLDFMVPEEPNGSIMLLEISSSARVAVLRNNKMEPVVIEYGNSYSKNLWIAFQKGEFFYGQAAFFLKNEAAAPTSYCWFQDLHEIFIDESMLAARYRFPIGHRPVDMAIRIEYLLGLYIQNLKKTCERKLNLVAGSMEKLIIMVPLWFASIQRQLLRLAGSFAGFENVILINEATAVPLFYIANSSSTESLSDRHFLVIVENSKNLDFAVYEYKIDRDDECKCLEMLWLDGNMYECQKTPDGVAKRFQRLKHIQERVTRNSMTTLATDLVQEAFDEFKNSGWITEGLEVIIYCHNTIWNSIFKEVVMKTFGNSVVICQNYLDSLIYMGKQFFRNEAVQIQPQEFPERIVELNSLTFYRRDMEDSYIPCTLLKKFDKLPKDVLQLKNKSGIPASTHVLVYQRTIVGEEILIGNLKMARFLYYLYPEIGTCFVVDKEGILKFDHVYGITAKGIIEPVPKKYVNWKTETRTDEDIKFYRLKLNNLKKTG